jgi:uncharacterized protein YcfL
MRKLIPLILALVMLVGCSGKGPDNIVSPGATMPEIIDQL